MISLPAVKENTNPPSERLHARVSLSVHVIKEGVVKSDWWVLLNFEGGGIFNNTLECSVAVHNIFFGLSNGLSGET